MKDIHWVLLRGLARETRHWGGFPKLLKNKCAGVTTIELPGIGTRFKDDPPWKLENYIPGLRLKYLQIPSETKMAILGISMGGMLAQSWMDQFPQDFSFGVIINSSSSSLSPFYHRVRPRALKFFLDTLMAKDLYSREKGILKFTTNKIVVQRKLIEEHMQFTQEYIPDTKALIKQLWAAKNFQAPKNLTPQVLFLSSQKDRLTNPLCSQKLAEHFDTDLRTHPDAGHDIPLDDPEWIIRMLENFVTKN